MDDRQEAITFNDQLDDLLNNDSAVVPFENGELLAVAQRLANADFSHQSHIRQPLYARLHATASPVTNHMYGQRRLLTAALSFIIIAALIFTVPPLRTLAQEIVKRLQTLTLTNAPSIVEFYMTATPTTDPANPPVMQLDLSLQQAIDKAGFAPLLPVYLPTPYLQSSYTANNGRFTSDFEPQWQSGTNCCAVLSLTQTVARPDMAPFPVGDAPIKEIEVRGVRGLWVQDSQTGMTPDENGVLRIMPVNILTWEADGYLFWMSSYDAITNHPLPEVEMLKIANGLEMAAQ